MGEHSLSAAPTHSRWNRSLEPRLIIASGDTVHLECQDASGAQVRPGMTLEQYLTIDTSRIHALTGPIWIEGAEPGDTLQIDILGVAHKGWGWSSIISGAGFLKERFPQTYLFHWQLEPTLSRSFTPAVVPLRPFCGVMGVAAAEDGEFRTIPPGIFGGNMDVRDLCAGGKLYLPVLNRGALFSAGDAHAAQGDGEVCITGIECPADVTLRFDLHEHRALPAPFIESPPLRESVWDDGAWGVVESATDPVAAARAATSRMIDLLVAHWSLSDIHAYILCSVALHLRLSQVVNEPMFTVSALLPKRILPSRQLFATNLPNPGTPGVTQGHLL
jgi:acetamidase/formamidase